MQNETYINALIRLQHLSWYLIALYFAATTAMLFLGVEIATAAIRGGIGIVLTVATLRLVVIALQFRASRLRKFELLAYALILMLVLIVLAKLLI